jgi:hypothetical protein
MRFVKTIVAISLLVPAVATSKTGIARIEVSIGEASVARIDDRAITREFTIFSGPGTSGGPITGEYDFADWAAGSVSAPAAVLTRYDVRFFCEPRRAGDLPRRCYGVRYVRDAARGAGFIYLPKHGEPNSSSDGNAIVHGVEGSWFRSTPKWDKLVGAVIAKQAGESR